MPRLPGLQLLRALAAFMVLVGHVLAEAEHYLAVPLPGDAIPWTRGVDIFFVISGFVITLSATRFLGQPGPFLWRRILRVVPLYWVFTTLMVATLLLIPSGPKDTQLDLVQIVNSYAFIPYERADGRIAPVLSLGWTLNYEMFFYVLAALCLALPRPFLALAMVMTGLCLAGAAMPASNALLITWTDPLLLEFLMGVGLGKLWVRGWHAPHLGAAVTGICTGLALMVMLHDTDLPRWMAAGLPAAVVVASGTLLCPTRRMPGVIWGDASYALYLSHRFVLRGATLLLVPVLPATLAGALIYVDVVTILSLAVGLLTYLWIERPMMRVMAPDPRGATA